MMNIAAVIRLHFIPESEGSSPELYKDIHFEKDKYSSFLQEMPKICKSIVPRIVSPSLVRT